MKTLLLIDANSLIHRCFHALPPLTNDEGQSTGALYGLSSILIKIFSNQPDKNNNLLFTKTPDFMAAFFDRPEPTFRQKVFKEYKSQRPRAPLELIFQIKEARHLFEKFKIKTFELAGFEADDLIATTVSKFKNEPDLKIIILTSDLDTLQLVENNKIIVQALKKGVSETLIYNEETVKKHYGIFPHQVRDYKSLVGDVSDNIPGVKGVGPKTASFILQKYNNLKNFLKSGHEEKFYPKIFESSNQIFLTKMLVSLRNDAEIPVKNIQDLTGSNISRTELIPYFENLGFQSLIKRIKKNQPTLI